MELYVCLGSLTVYKINIACYSNCLDSIGYTVKVKVKDTLASTFVENCYYISKVSFDSLECYATVRADLGHSNKIVCFWSAINLLLMRACSYYYYYYNVINNTWYHSIVKYGAVALLGTTLFKICQPNT